MGFFALLMWIVVAILVFLLGVLIAQTIEWGMNGLDKGKVKTELTSAGLVPNQEYM